MRKALILVGMFLISFTLVACGEDVDTVTLPSFNSMTIDGIAPVADGELVTFYKGKNETILIEVSLNNPDGLLITSIIIDGYNYFASRFTDDSTRSTIYFEMSAGTTLGPKILSLDEIVYKNGDLSESILITSNNEFSKYVFMNIPTVERESYSVTPDSIVVNFDILDIDEVVVTDTLIAELYSGETLVDSEILSIGETEVAFSDLLSNKNYEIKVKANYDLDDDLGARTNVVLYSELFSTLDNSIPNASIINPVVTSNSIVFDVVYIDEDNVTKDVDGIKVGVYRDGILVDDIPFVYLVGSTTGVTIVGLLNDNEYTIKVISKYDLGDGYYTKEAPIATHTFSTNAKSVIEPTVLDLSIEENRIIFSFELNNPDGIIDEDSVEVFLYIDGQFKESIVVSEFNVYFQVNDLFANTNFVIEIEASINLNDGEGWIEDQVIYRLEDTTYENEAPSVVVSELLVTQGYITIKLNVVDDDSTLNGALTAILYEIYMLDDVEIINEVGRIQFDIDASELVFAHLTNYLKGYRVDVIADFDLIDGTEPKTNVNLFKSIMISSERKAPAAELLGTVLTTESISLNINLMDSDDTIIPGSMIVYLVYNGEIVVGSEKTLVIGDVNPIEFTGLLSNNEYIIIIEVDYTYDLIDSSVILSSFKLSNNRVFTLEKEKATAEVLEVFSDSENITFKVVVDDDFDTIDELTLIAELYLDDIYQEVFIELEVGNNFGETFNNLKSDRQYEIRIMTEYDLNDGNEYLDVIQLNNYFVYTSDKERPSYTNFNIEATQDEISFEIEIIDIDGVIDDNLVVKLYLGDVYQNVFIDLEVGVNSGELFAAVDSGENYNIRIEADFNYNNVFDESDLPIVLESEQLAWSSINTLTNLMITAEITEVISDKNTTSFDVFIIDDDIVNSGVINAVLYDEFGVAVVGVDPEPLTIGDNSVVFIDLLSDTDFTIVIEANYDLNLKDIDEVIGGELASVETTTLALTPLTASITIDTEETLNTRIEFDVSVVDSDSTYTQELRALLYKDGVYQDRFILLDIGLNENKFFDDLDFGYEYEIVIISDYYLNDGNLVAHDGIELTRASETTVTIILIDEIVEDKKFISFNISIDDIFNVLLPIGDVIGVEVRLFDENHDLVGDVFFVEEPTDFDLVNLWSDYNYSIEIRAEYDVGFGTVINEVFIYEFQTLLLEIPEMTIELDHDVLEAGTNIAFDVSGVSDTDGIISGFVDNGTTPGTLEAVLYIDDVEVTSIPIPANGTYAFAGYDGTDGRDYAIVIQAVVDLNEDATIDNDFDFVTKSWIWAIKN